MDQSADEETYSAAPAAQLKPTLWNNVNNNGFDFFIAFSDTIQTKLASSENQLKGQRIQCDPDDASVFPILSSWTVQALEEEFGKFRLPYWPVSSADSRTRLVIMCTGIPTRQDLIYSLSVNNQSWNSNRSSVNSQHLF